MIHQADFPLSDYFYFFAEKSQDVIWVRSPDYKKQIYMSPIYEQVWGRPCQDLYNHPEIWENSLHPQDKKRLEDSIAQRNPLVSPQDVYVETYRIIRPDGNIRSIRDKSFPLFKDNQLIAFAGIAQDITEQETANLLKTEFIQNMQHDIRTPASGIWGMLNYLEETEQDLERKELLTLTCDSAKCLLDICNELIEFDEINRHEFPEISRKIDLRQLVENVIALNQAAAFQKKLILQSSVDQNLPHLLGGDTYRVSRILINLIGNAIKFTHTGSVSIHAELESTTEKKILVLFKIQDTGIGIQQEKQDYIFEKFVRLNPSNRGQYKGSGLGLQIVKQFTQELGGKVTLDSELGKGTTFYITLPFEKLMSNSSEQPNMEPAITLSYETAISMEKQPTNNAFIEPEKSNNDLIKVLLIEDDPLARMAGLITLQSAGCHVNVADTVQRALEVLSSIQFQLIVSDLGLPDGSGNDIIRAIKQNPQSLNYQTPFFALTAHSDSKKRDEAKKAGFLMVMTKPLTQEHFKSLIDLYIHNQANRLKAEEAPAPGELSFIDMKLAEKRVGNNSQLAVELLDMLVASLPDNLAIIQSAYQNNDIQIIRDEFHKLYGGLCYCGTPRLSKALQKVHEAVKTTADLTSLEDLFNNLYKEVDFLLKAHKELRKNKN